MCVCVQGRKKDGKWEKGSTAFKACVEVTVFVWFLLLCVLTRVWVWDVYVCYFLSSTINLYWDPENKAGWTDGEGKKKKKKKTK